MKSPINPTMEIPHPPVQDTTKVDVPVTVPNNLPEVEPATGTQKSLIVSGSGNLIKDTELKKLTVTDGQTNTQFKTS